MIIEKEKAAVKTKAARKIINSPTENRAGPSTLSIFDFYLFPTFRPPCVVERKRGMEDDLPYGRQMRVYHKLSG
ncbi:hypothetical protein OUZ56_011942 [Daphnia magna]|uniref:Uncharacterized protein n=1 Tax=Daphnia magna TaxID=35525 RepID=A0ABQ9Z1K1_9CRUS|nr:hypothetical protein OUZ56_011942 [Daphnia magna]